MNEQTFRTFCAVAILLMFGLIGWTIYHNVEQKQKDQEGIHIKAPFFEYERTP